MKKIIRLSGREIRNIIRESVEKAINEIKVDNPHDRLMSVDRDLSGMGDEMRSYMKGRGDDLYDSIEMGIAELMVDNGLSFDDIRQYDTIMGFIDQKKLNDAVKAYKEELSREDYSDKAMEAQAWAEDRMSDMGFGFEGD